MTRKEIEDLAESAAGRLAEHASSVLIIITVDQEATDGTGPRTGIFKTGGGNHYAQVGSAIEWLNGRDNAFLPPSTPPPNPPVDGDQWKG